MISKQKVSFGIFKTNISVPHPHCKNKGRKERTEKGRKKKNYYKISERKYI
jgi:hypothetical protein